MISLICRRSVRNSRGNLKNEADEKMCNFFERNFPLVFISFSRFINIIYRQYCVKKVKMIFFLSFLPSILTRKKTQTNYELWTFQLGLLWVGRQNRKKKNRKKFSRIFVFLVQHISPWVIANTWDRLIS